MFFIHAGTCAFTNDETKYILRQRSIVALSSNLSCNLVVSSSDGMRLFVLYCNDKTDSSLRVMRSVQEITGTERDIDFKHGRSRRLLLRSDGFSVGFCTTIIHPETLSKMQYVNHLELVYYYTGGKLTYIFHDENVEVKSKADADNGTAICLDKHDKHTADTTKMTCAEDAECISIFYPPLVGQEAHSFSDDGFSAYELIED